MPSDTYIDAKGRNRWHRNDQIAHRVKQLGDFLIIGGYPESHAKRYAQIAHTISRWPESLDRLAQAGELGEIPGVGGVIADYIGEIVRTGTTAKFADTQYGTPPPQSVLELTDIPGLGVKTARLLYTEQQIDSLQSLHQALSEGRLAKVKGIGPKLLQTITDHSR